MTAKAHQPSSSGSSDASEARQLLREVHEVVLSNRRASGLQTMTAVILALATLTSTWCGYQASRWSGLQSGLQAAADTAQRQAAENTLAGLQVRTQDGLVLLEYWRAKRSGDAQTHEMILAHMRPELKRGLEASLRQGILENPAVTGPLQQPEYALEVERIAAMERREAQDAQDRAAVAGRAGSEYVLLTLLLASALFVGGVSNTFSRRSVRGTLAYTALVVFLIASVRMAFLPVLWPIAGS